MSDMTDAAALALRKPFPAESVGKLPKPTSKDNKKGKCGECGGWHGLPAVHLDYVGHAAVTDRLLTVDPSWTWRPFTGEEIAALPPSLRDGGLWIMLTICGVTKPGFGDAQGKSGGNAVKEMIGDAIRNAAMRFGVSLDLWAKENLVEFAQAVHEREAQVKPAEHRDFPATAAEDAQTVPEQRDAPPPEAAAAKPAMTKAQRGQMFALFNELGIPEDQQLSGINQITGGDYTSRGDLTKTHAKAVIDTLQARKEARP